MRDQQFYDVAQHTPYPFDDASYLVDDLGKRLPEGLLADFSCILDSQYGDRIYCSSVSKRSNQLTMVFSSQQGQVLGSLIATSVKAVYATPPLQVPLKSFVNGFKGLAVLGEQWAEIEDGSWMFSQPEASVLAARCCFPLAFPSEQTIAVFDHPALQGATDLRSEGSIVVSLGTRQLGQQTKKAIILSLAGSTDLRDFAGPNQRRPESRTCGDPQPVETVNGVGADCCGRVFLELRGCAQPIPISNKCGVVLDCPITLEELCPTDAPPPADVDECLGQGAINPINPEDDQPGYPTLPPW